LALLALARGSINSAGLLRGKHLGPSFRDQLREAFLCFTIAAEPSEPRVLSYPRYARTTLMRANDSVFLKPIRVLSNPLASR